MSIIHNEELLDDISHWYLHTYLLVGYFAPPTLIYQRQKAIEIELAS